MRHGQVRLPHGLDPNLLIEAATRHGARNVRVFGSVAQGTATEDSDLDLLVDMEPGRDLLDLIAFKRELEEAIDRKVDVLTENSLSPYLRERILGEAASDRDQVFLKHILEALERITSYTREGERPSPKSRSCRMLPCAISR